MRHVRSKNLCPVISGSFDDIKAYIAVHIRYIIIHKPAIWFETEGVCELYKMFHEGLIPEVREETSRGKRYQAPVKETPVISLA